MIHQDNTNKTVQIENGALRIVLSYADGVQFQELTNLYGGKAANRGREAFVLTIYDKEYTARDFKVEDIDVETDELWSLVTFTLSLDSEKLKMKLHLIDEGEAVRVLYQLWDGYKLGVPSVTFLHLPLLAALEANGDGDCKHYPSGALVSKKGTDVLKPMMEYFHSADILMPLVVSDSKERIGFSVEFPFQSDLSDAGATQNINKQLVAIADEEQLKNHKLRANPDASFNDMVELRISALQYGWMEAFDRYRDGWQSRYDFSEYDRPDLQWFNDRVVHNFVFLYGKEGFDHENQRIDVAGLLRQGEDFGGYDTVTIWNQYPRLGIDVRNQWAFYDDFPGGRAAIKEAVDEFHKKDVPVFLPYIPWDRGMKETTETMGDEFARIVADTDADGYQLDTLTDLPYSFRKKLDAIRPGLILTTQHHPLKKHPVEFITTSWDEFWRFDPMPEVDVFRFMCPRHIAPVISRWLRMEDKSVLIQRCEFGVAPIVIWQDIFGRWLPFSDEQKAEIKRWKACYLKYRAIYQGRKPIPLLPTFCPNLYCNLFVGDGGEGQIYAFYNDTDSAVQLKDYALSKYDGTGAEVVFGSGSASLKDNKLTAEIPSKTVVHILVK